MLALSDTHVEGSGLMMPQSTPNQRSPGESRLLEAVVRRAERSVVINAN
jgi:hypothetical protein